MQTKFPRWKLVLFAFLSACDFVITYLLITRSQGRVYESNPLADEWLQQGGWIGLAAFKTLIVVGVSMIAVYIYRRRPRIAHDLLAIGCGAVVVAVATGTSIAMTLGKPPSIEADAWSPKLATIANPAPPPLRDYSLALEQAAFGLAAKQMDLSEAVAMMQQTDRGQNEEWIELLRQAYPGVEDRALLAADLIQHCVSMRLRTPQASRMASQLEAQFRELYGFEPKLPYRQLLHLAPKSKSPRAHQFGRPHVIPQ